MALSADEIAKVISEGLVGAEVNVEDIRGDGQHFAAYVASPDFKGKTRVQQHQMVYAVLEEKIGDQLHALALQTVPVEN